MKRILSKQSSYFYGLSNALFSILILTAVTLQPRISFGQAEKPYESMLISDAAIPDFLAMAKTDVVHEDSMRLMFKIKEDSLKNRLKQAQSSFEILKVLLCVMCVQFLFFVLRTMNRMVMGFLVFVSATKSKERYTATASILSLLGT